MYSGICFASIASGSGKTLITLSVLRSLAKRQFKTRPFKIGPDYIDPLFHKAAAFNNSINLDLFIMSKKQLLNTFLHYSYNQIPVIEGVMGFYDGFEDEFSTYDVASLLNTNTILIISAKGLYSTVAPLIHGMTTFKQNNTISAVIINNVSSQNHFNRIKQIITKYYPDLNVLGFVLQDNNLLTKERHLGLDIDDIYHKDFNSISKSVCSNIDMHTLIKLALSSKQAKKDNAKPSLINSLDKDTLKTTSSKTIAIINDNNAFAFLYHDNVIFLKSIFKQVHMINPLEDMPIPADSDVVYIPGGYVETKDISSKLNNACKFKNSLIAHVNNNKRVFAECAGLIYLGESVTDVDGNVLPMSGIIPLSFEMCTRRQRLGYYIAKDKLNASYKGHAFHYSKVKNPTSTKSFMHILKYNNPEDKTLAGWQFKNVFATYLHSMFRSSPHLIKNYFI